MDLKSGRMAWPFLLHLWAHNCSRVYDAMKKPERTRIYQNHHLDSSRWNFRSLTNILFLHNNHLKRDPESESLRIAQYLDFDVPEGSIENILNMVSLKTMRRNAVEKERDDEGEPFMIGGARSFFHKGTNNRWRDVMKSEDLSLYDEVADRELSTDCRQWLEQGLFDLTDPLGK